MRLRRLGGGIGVLGLRGGMLVARNGWRLALRLVDRGGRLLGSFRVLDGGWVARRDN